jgi:hypothetical protein
MRRVWGEPDSMGRIGHTGATRRKWDEEGKCGRKGRAQPLPLGVPLCVDVKTLDVETLVVKNLDVKRPSD